MSAEPSRHSQPLQQEATVQLQQASLQAAMAHRACNRLKDFRQIATRYDRLARNYLSSVCLVASLVWWI